MPFKIGHGRISKGSKGKTWKLSDETKLKMSLSKKGKIPCVAPLAWKKNKGRNQSEEHKENIRNGLIKSWDKRGRKKHKRYIHLTGTRQYKAWRSSVFSRDNYTCQECGARGVYIEAHHIKGWAKFPELRFDVSNGICLCRDCHKLTDNYKGKSNGIN